MITRRTGLQLAAAATIGAMALGLVALPATSADDIVNVYSYRQPSLVKPLFDAFTEQTGIKVNVVSAKKGLVERLEHEGPNSPADLIFTVDIGRLNDAKQAGVTQGVKTDALLESIPPQYRDPDGHWYGLTLRARIAYVSKDRVAAAETPKTYEALADATWKGRVCTRSGSHAYQVALTAAMIEHYGDAKTEKWLRAVKANLARKPQGNDRAQVKAIKEGVCDVALGNNYYYGLMVKNPDQQAWAAAVNPVFLSLAGSGTHVNISGVALTKASPNKANAVRLMEFLTSDLAQKMYADQNYEYPIVEGVEADPLLRKMGALHADTVSLAAVADRRGDAIKLIDRVGYND